MLTSPFALDIRAKAAKIAQTLFCSQTRRFQSLLRNLSPIFGRKKGKINNLLPNWKVFLCCVVLKCSKCFAFILITLYTVTRSCPLSYKNRTLLDYMKLLVMNNNTDGEKRVLYPFTPSRLQKEHNSLLYLFMY